MAAVPGGRAARPAGRQCLRCADRSAGWRFVSWMVIRELAGGLSAGWRLAVRQLGDWLTPCTALDEVEGGGSAPLSEWWHALLSQPPLTGLQPLPPPSPHCTMLAVGGTVLPVYPTVQPPHRTLLSAPDPHLRRCGAAARCGPCWPGGSPPAAAGSRCRHQRNRRPRCHRARGVSAAQSKRCRGRAAASGGGGSGCRQVARRSPHQFAWCGR